MMSDVIVVPCNERDQELLPLLIENLHSVGWDGEICVAPCAKHPPATNIDTTSSVRWYTGNVTSDMLKALSNASKTTGAKNVYKMDADVFLNRIPEWMSDVQTLTGYRHPQDARYIGGALYGMPVDVLTGMIGCAHKMRHTILEDVGVSRLARTAKIPFKIMQEGIEGWGGKGYQLKEEVDVVHLGQNHDRRFAADLHKQCRER